jgi:hypothetical protein
VRRAIWSHEQLLRSDQEGIEQSMSGVLTTISSLISPNLISTLGKQFGMSDELVRQGIGISSAVLAGGMARAASTPDGAAMVAQMVDQADPGLLGNLNSLLTGVIASPPNVARQLYGSNYELVVGGVKKASGIDITPILGLVAPVMLAVIKNLTVQQGLDAAGITSIVQSEIKGLARRDATTANVLKEIYKPLEAQDKLRNSYTPEEWETLQQGPVYAAALIILADRSGSSGRSKEVEALKAALSDAAGAAGPSELNGLLFRDGVAVGKIEELVKEHRKTDLAELQALLIAPISAAVTLVKAKAAKSDATAYQGLLIGAAQQVASAVKEGGFLGMGGTNVSDDEKAALDALAAAVAAA